MQMSLLTLLPSLAMSERETTFKQGVIYTLDRSIEFNNVTIIWRVEKKPFNEVKFLNQ